ncbi:NACHT domain-containing protein [Acrocarpospora macrocephala]
MQFSYGEAVRVLGGETRTLQALDRAFGGLLLGAAMIPGTSGVALSLFDAKTEAVRLGHQLIGSLREKVTGTSRYTRTERLHAAHTIIITTAFFEALDDIEVPFSLKRLDLTYAEKSAIFSAGKPRRAALRFPLESSDGIPMSEIAAGILFRRQHKAYSLACDSLIAFIAGLAVWEELNSTEKDRAQREIYRLPRFAADRYEQMYRQLAIEFPEFAFWAYQREHHETQEQIRHGLGGLNSMLAAITSGRVPPPQLRSILALNHAALARPISPTKDRPGNLALPTLADGYVNPRFRVITGQEDLSLEESWAAEPIRDDLQQMLAGFVTSMAATRSPLLVLGQPGVGKSVLTQVLAARLPAGDFLPIRVPLRQVPADAGIQEQIEAAIRVATGETLNWPELSRSADGALPIVLLDGLDELLQATGVNRADYLVQAAEFQTREAELGRPVAVIVTTRTAVADRCRLPGGTVAVKLEPFSDDQVKLWIDTWNSTNATHFASTGREPLAYDDVLAHRELAEQPLLLLMLALYDADSATGPTPTSKGALHEASGLSLGELYERLLHGFAAREVDKHEPSLSPARREAAIERELLRLSVAAFAMFNRGQQWVTHDDLDRDLTALIPDPPTPGVGFQRPLTAAQTVIGRFFFMHQALALQDSNELSTYEFLHATFGEYLIARLVRDLLREGAAREIHDHEGILGGIFSPRPDRRPLGALLSFAVLSVRASIPEFLINISEPGENLRPFLQHQFQEIYFGTELTRSNYEPMALSAIQRIARQTANLVLLTTVLTGPVTAAELFGPDAEAVWRWQHLVDLWRAGMHHDEWPSMVSALGIARSWDGDRRVLTVYWTGSHQVLPVSYRSKVGELQTTRDVIWETQDPLAWAHNKPPTADPRQWRALPAHTMLDTGAGRSVNAEIFTPIFHSMPYAVTSIASTSDGASTSLFTAFNDLRLPDKQIYPVDHPPLTEAYARVFEMISRIGRLPREHFLREVLIRLFEDLRNLTAPEASALLIQALPLVSLDPIIVGEGDYLVTCALYLVARDRDYLELLGRVLYELPLPGWLYLEAAVTLMELDVDPSEVPATAFDVVRRLRADELIGIEREHPHLFHRARRIIRADGGRYRLVWPT